MRQHRDSHSIIHLTDEERAAAIVKNHFAKLNHLIGKCRRQVREKHPGLFNEHVHVLHIITPRRSFLPLLLRLAIALTAFLIAQILFQSYCFHRDSCVDLLLRKWSGW